MSVCRQRKGEMRRPGGRRGRDRRESCGAAAAGTARRTARAAQGLARGGTPGELLASPGAGAPRPGAGSARRRSAQRREAHRHRLGTTAGPAPNRRAAALAQLRQVRQWYPGPPAGQPGGRVGHADPLGRPRAPARGRGDPRGDRGRALQAQAQPARAHRRLHHRAGGPLPPRSRGAAATRAIAPLGPTGPPPPPCGARLHSDRRQCNQSLHISGRDSYSRCVEQGPGGLAPRRRGVTDSLRFPEEARVGIGIGIRHVGRAALVAGGAVVTTLAAEVLAARNHRFLPSDPVMAPSCALGPEEGEPLVLAVLGDSSVAGVGADCAQDTLTYGLALALVERYRVHLYSLGTSGARLHHVVSEQVPRLAELDPDVVLVCVGTNDITHVTPVYEVRRQLRLLGAGLVTAAPRAVVLVSGLPPAETSRAFRGKREMFSPDLFHPSSAGYTFLGKFYGQAVRKALEAARDAGAATPPDLAGDLAG